MMNEEKEEMLFCCRPEVESLAMPLVFSFFSTPSKNNIPIKMAGMMGPT